MRRRSRISRTRAVRPGVTWTCTGGGMDVADPGISNNQFWRVGLLTDEEFEDNKYRTAKARLERIRGEIFLTNGLEAGVAPLPNPLVQGFSITTLFTFGVMRDKENKDWETGAWDTCNHDGNTYNPWNAAFYTGATDVLFRQTYVQVMEFTQMDGELALWRPRNMDVIQFDVKVRRNLTDKDGLYFFIYPQRSDFYFDRSFQGYMNCRTLFTVKS